MHDGCNEKMAVSTTDFFFDVLSIKTILFSRYLRRLFHYRQMDFEFAFWQMVYLLSNPKIVYKNFTYRKKTKAQFARDDPAFLVLLAGWLVVSS